jgi:hypothetical protein
MGAPDSSGVPYNTFIRNGLMTTTFADYAAAAEARKNIQEAVLGHTYALCEALRQNFIEYNIKSHEHSILNAAAPEQDPNSATFKYHVACIQDLKNGNCGYEFYPETGRKYHKIIMNANGSRSVHCFIDKKTGEVYKAASYQGPAKGVRFDLRLIEQREWLLEHADWAGSYLYAR